MHIMSRCITEEFPDPKCQDRDEAASDHLEVKEQYSDPEATEKPRRLESQGLGSKHVPPTF